MAIFFDSHPHQHLPITLTLVNKPKPRLQRETQNQRLLSASSSHFFFLLLRIFALNSLFLFLFFSFFSLWKFFIVVVYCDFLGFRSTIAGNHGFSGESFVTPLSLSPCMNPSHRRCLQISLLYHGFLGMYFPFPISRSF